MMLYPVERLGKESYELANFLLQMTYTFMLSQCLPPVVKQINEKHHLLISR